MNASDHQKLNFALGALNGLFRCLQEAATETQPSAGDVFFQTLASGLGAVTTAGIPDWIDPPTSPAHRNWGHGVVQVGLLTGKAYDAAQAVKNPIVRRFLEGAAIGPAGHLLGDATTPAGINFIRRGF